MRTVNHGTITGTLSLFKIWPLNGFIAIREKKTSQETEKSLRKFFEPSQKPKVISSDNSLESVKYGGDLSWNHRISTPRSETNDMAEWAIRRVKEGTSAVLLQSRLDERWWSDSMELYFYLRNVQDLLADWKTRYGRRIGELFKGPLIPFWSNGCLSSDFTERSHKSSSIW